MPASSHVDYEIPIRTELYRVYFRSDDLTLTANPESYLACALLPNMKTEQAISAGGNLSRKLLDAIPAIQDIYHGWDPALSRVDIHNAVPVAAGHAVENRVGVFFSGGVDSFYTLIKHRDEITDLIFVHGFDIKVEDMALRNKVSDMVRNVAASFGKRAVEIESDLRSCLDRFADWGDLAHGAALAATGHLMSRYFRRIYIPASYSYDNLFNWGSHPDLDPLWSSESLEFVHDGLEASRVDKVAVIFKHDIVLQNLRVCWKNTGGAYNCGICEKCIRTMISLHVAGALKRCKTFDTSLDITEVLNIKPDRITRTFIEQNLKALESKGRPEDMELVRALRLVLHGPSWLRKVKKWKINTNMRLKNMAACIG